MNRSAVGFLVLLSWVFAAACDDLFGPKRSPGALELSPRVLTLNDAATGQLAVTVLDRDGQEYTEIPRGLTLTWSASPATVASVHDGLVTANRPGNAFVHVRSGALADSARIIVNPVATQMVAAGGIGQSGLTCEPLPDSVMIRVLDRHGDGVAQVRVDFRVTAGGGEASPTVTVTDAAGAARARWRLGNEPGPQFLEAVSDEALAGAPVAFDAEAWERPPPIIESVEPATLVPGTAAVVRGENLGADPACITVRVADRLAAVTETAPDRLTVQLAPRADYACEPRPEAAVEVTVANATVSRQHPVEIGVARPLEVGGSVLVLNPEEVRCTRLETGGRYFISVFNTLTNTGASAFEFRGVGTATSDAVVLAGSERSGSTRAATVGAGAPPDRTITPPGSGRAATTGEDLHFRVLEENIRLLERLGPVPPRAAHEAPPLAADGLPQEGQELTIRVPDIRSGNLCLNRVDRPARVVYVGERAIVLEDVDAPLARQMDGIYRAIGAEWDDVMYDVLRTHFGDPFAINDRTSGLGRVLMMFTQQVNQAGGIAGFVSSGDLYTRAQCAGSNEAEVFYAYVPTRLDSNLYSSAHADGWHHQIRSTVIHEGKHIVSFAERLARPSPTFEASWLEEATARIAEEIWVRHYYGYGQFANTGYAESVQCEIHPDRAECGGRPLAMWKHFSVLHQHFANVERCSPLGTPSGNANLCPATFYASGWSFTRWIADHYGGAEADFFQTLTQDATRSGIDNLEARSGRGYAELLGGWTLANAVDGWPGIAATRPELGHPSWHTRDVFAGMARDRADRFQPWPLAVRQVDFGDFLVSVGEVRGGTAAHFELSGTAAGTQMVEVRGAGGTPPPETLRIGIVRVE